MWFEGYYSQKPTETRMELKERDIEKYLKKKVKEAGGETRKLKWIGRRGAPDRVVFLNGAHFVELKRPGCDLRSEQLREVSRLRKHGAEVWVLPTLASVDTFVRWTKGGDTCPVN